MCRRGLQDEAMWLHIAVYCSLGGCQEVHAPSRQVHPKQGTRLFEHLMQVAQLD